MASDRFLVAQFCDDVRQEVGNKLTLVGCYNEDLQVAGFPTVLPKLCVVAKVHTLIERPFKSLSLRVRSGDRVVAELAASPETFASPAAVTDGSRWVVLTGVLSMVPFPLEKETQLQVEAQTEEDELLVSPKLFVRKGATATAE